jgi:hypothetical protein
MEVGIRADLGACTVGKGAEVRRDFVFRRHCDIANQQPYDTNSAAEHCVDRDGDGIDIIPRDVSRAEFDLDGDGYNEATAGSARAMACWC